jgi:AAA+ superfamily predicted ATPase
MENELGTGKTMTVKELADNLHVSIIAVLNLK